MTDDRFLADYAPGDGMLRTTLARMRQAGRSELARETLARTWHQLSLDQKRRLSSVSSSAWRSGAEPNISPPDRPRAPVFVAEPDLVPRAPQIDTGDLRPIPADAPEWSEIGDSVPQLVAWVDGDRDRAELAWAREARVRRIRRKTLASALNAAIGTEDFVGG